LVSSERSQAFEYIKSHSRKASDVMTRDVITANPDTPLGDIAAVLECNRIKRVPIVEGSKIVGIVSRANILPRIAAAEPHLGNRIRQHHHNEAQPQYVMVGQLQHQPERHTLDPYWSSFRHLQPDNLILIAVDRLIIHPVLGLLTGVKHLDI
jgi:CBS-domain-containing membrane protein